jgi:hypothetical protein
MLRPIICASSIVLFLVASALGEAWSQVTPPQGPSQSLSDPPQKAEANKAIQTPSGKAGKEEPSSHTPTTTLDDTHVLVNGSLAVQGAPTETETTPAKYSKKNAADDKLITVAYTFKALPNDQRQAIYLALKNEPAVTAPGTQVGTVLSIAVPTREIPPQLATNVPAARGFHFLVSDNRVVLISPATRIVVGVFTDEPPRAVGDTVQ